MQPILGRPHARSPSLQRIRTNFVTGYCGLSSPRLLERPWVQRSSSPTLSNSSSHGASGADLGVRPARTVDSALRFRGLGLEAISQAVFGLGGRAMVTKRVQRVDRLAEGVAEGPTVGTLL
jgi:hypothetical protein